MQTKELIIEILCEELPAQPLLDELQNIPLKWHKALQNVGLDSDFEFYYTPRRLVFFHSNFKQKADDREEEIIGAPKVVAYDKDGKLSKAGLAFLNRVGISENEIAFKEIKGKEVLYAKHTIVGKKAEEILGTVVDDFLKSLHFKKTMRWGDNDFAFIRPIQNIACVFDGKVINFNCFGVESNNITFLHKDKGFEGVEFNNFKQYLSLLENGGVILDAKIRREKILSEITQIEKKTGLKVGKDDELLEHIVAITEYPRAILGSFDEKFLAVPSEAIITSMKDNQKYFAVFNQNNELSAHFVVVINSLSDDFSVIKDGNERVLRARLEDALFFWENDLKAGLNPEKLKDMMYVEGLGSLYDKTMKEVVVYERLAVIYKDILGKNAKLGEKAIMYSKADLCTQMVGEFGELEGIMGARYAKYFKFEDEVCDAIYDQYLPKGDSDLPRSDFACVVSLAMKLESLLALFSIGKIPSGSKDPYALRRAATACIKIILKLDVSFDLAKFLEQFSSYKLDLAALNEFILERLFSQYDLNPSYVRACISNKGLDFVMINKAILAIQNIDESDISTFKRVANITKDFNDEKYDKNLFENEYEKSLVAAFESIQISGDLVLDFKNLLSLKSKIDEFFENVMINVENKSIKNNRKALIYSIYKAFLNIADLKELS